ncbi:MAG TPA: BACON domain-containing carbohydrate-binding protein, partial [Kofleriaceae bacterium]|nr:BACON domain-containing carbohydrate-binding protein [Kofleriaceae bacterium]
MVRRVRSAAALICAAAALLLVPVEGRAAVTSSNVASGILTISIDDNPTVVAVTCDGGNVLVNGGNPTSGQKACADLTQISVVGGAAADTIDLSGVTAGAFTGVDTMTISTGAGADTITGSSLSDTIQAGANGDSIDGGPGDDLFVYSSGDGSDLVEGGGGNDHLGMAGSASGETITIEMTANGVTVARTDLGLFTLDVRTTETIEIRANDGDDVITAESDVDVALELYGDGGADTLRGGAAADDLVGGPGADTMNGDGGDDQFTWADGDGSDLINGSDGTDLVSLYLSLEGDQVVVASGPDDAVLVSWTNLGPFTVDARAIELLSVVSDLGNDTFTTELFEEVELEYIAGSGDDVLTVDAACTAFSEPEEGVVEAVGRRPLMHSGFDEVTIGGGVSVTADDAFPAEGGEGNLDIDTGDDCDWTAESSESWLEIATGSGTGPAGLAFTVAPNDGDERSAEIHAAGLVVTVTQAAGDAGPDDDDDGDSGGCGCRAGARGGDAAVLLL